MLSLLPVSLFFSSNRCIAVAAMPMEIRLETTYVDTMAIIVIRGILAVICLYKLLLSNSFLMLIKNEFCIFNIKDR